MPRPRPAPRELNLFDATMLVMGGIVGVGIFFNPGQVARLVPNVPAFLVMWGIGGGIALCAAFTFAELGATFPRAGGWFVYLRECHGRAVAFLFAWVVLLVITTGALAVMANFCVGALEGIVPGVAPADTLARRLEEAGLLLLISALALCGVKVGALFQNACMLIKLGAIAALVVAGFVLFSPAEVSTILPTSAAPQPDAPPLWRGMILATLPVLFSCGGWQMLGYAAGFVKDARRTIPLAIVLGVCGVIVVYLALNSAYVRVVGLEHMAADDQFAAEVARRAIGSWGESALRVAMAISAVGVITVNVIVSPWVYVAMAREGLFFERFGRLHPRTGAPTLALGLQAAFALGYVFLGDPDFLVSSVVFVEWIFHALVAYGLLILCLRRPGLARPFASPRVFPLLYLVMATCIVLGNLWQNEARLTLTGLGLIGAGAIAYPLWRRLVARRVPRAR